MKSFRIAFLIIPITLLSGFGKNNERVHHSAPVLSTYEMRISHTGYTSFYGTPEDCPIRSNGTVILSGLLSGDEAVSPEDDIVYTGIMQLNIDMDICSAKRLANGEDKLCGMRVKGSGKVNVELVIYSDGEGNPRGAYIKFNHSPNLGKFEGSVLGDCDGAQMAEEKGMIPSKTIASIFNGRDLPMLTNRTLIPGSFVEDDEGNVTVVQVIRKIH